METSGRDDLQFELANFASRCKAICLDALLYMLMIYASAPILRQISDLIHVPWLAAIVMMIILLFYDALQVSLFGRTLGHRIFGLRVFGENGRNPSFPRALLRWYIKTILGVFAFLSMVGGGERAIQDIITKTTVRQVR